VVCHPLILSIGFLRSHLFARAAATPIRISIAASSRKPTFDGRHSRRELSRRGCAVEKDTAGAGAHAGSGRCSRSSPISARDEPRRPPVVRLARCRALHIRRVRAVERDCAPTHAVVGRRSSVVASDRPERTNQHTSCGRCRTRGISSASFSRAHARRRSCNDSSCHHRDRVLRSASCRHSGRGWDRGPSLEPSTE